MSLDPKQLASEALALKAAGRIGDAIMVYRRLVAAAPNDPIAEHNLAVALGDAGHWREAETHIRAAFAKGGDAPKTWLVLGRSLQSLGRFADAEAAFLQALKRDPNLYEAHADLVQLRWMLTADLSNALVDLDAAARATPNDIRLLLLKAKAMEQAGRLADAYALLRALASVRPNEAALLTTASQFATELGDEEIALAFAERAASLAPQERIVATNLVSACLAAGQADRAATLASGLRQHWPTDQHALALLATAWRILGDARYKTLYDYENLVFTSQIATPKAWSNLDAYLSDLAAGVRSAHNFTTHPFHQSIRHGSQAPDILHHDHPAIAALPEALAPPIKSYIAKLGPGPDPIRARNLGGYAYQGMWSIRMQAGGFHIDHVHPNGWISSACYIEVPKAMPNKEGWLKFGEPGIRTKPKLGAEHFVEPAPGKVALFPSYMWHGTVPFSDASARMSVAFDLTPARADTPQAPAPTPS